MSLRLSAEEQADIKELWKFELDLRKTPEVLEGYFVALRVANMLYARSSYKAANKWTSKAAERLEEAFETDGESVKMYLEEPDDPLDVDDEAEALPRKRRRRSKAEIIGEVVAKRTA
jgi:hypothetical protein